MLAALLFPSQQLLGRASAHLKVKSIYKAYNTFNSLSQKHTHTHKHANTQM